MTNKKPSRKNWLKTRGCLDNSKKKKYWQNRRYNYGTKKVKLKWWVYSKSFVQVGQFYSYWKKYAIKNKKGKTIIYKSRAKNSPLQKKIKKGDIVQMYWEGKWRHSVIITGGSKGDWKYTCHTSDRHNFPLVKAVGVEKYRIIRIK